MSYIDQNLLTNERILFRTKKHVILFFYPLVWSLFCFYASFYMLGNPILAGLIWVPWLVALVFWANSGLQYLVSDYVVTNRRLMMREGFFFRRAKEMRLAAISQVSIDQSLLGQVLGYGVVSLSAFGAYDRFSLVAHPVAFQKAVNEQLDQVTTK